VIRAIAAVDDRLGLATDDGIPWTIPADVAHFREATAGSDVLMGYATYQEFAKPMADSVNYVATGRGGELRDGFHAVDDVTGFLSGHVATDLWVIGGGGLFAGTLGLTEELVLTRVRGDFHCTKFFPSFEDSFELVTDTAPPDVPGTPAIRFQTWRRTGGATPAE
jgi:dihydrofolate reductase